MKKWICVVLVAGCSSAQWDRPGATAASVDADLRSCNATVQAVPGLPSPRTTSNSVEVRAASGGEPRRIGHERQRPSFETPRKGALLDTVSSG